jgi:hypothetical protein
MIITDYLLKHGPGGCVDDFRAKGGLFKYYCTYNEIKD